MSEVLSTFMLVGPPTLADKNREQAVSAVDSFLSIVKESIDSPELLDATRITLDEHPEDFLNSFPYQDGESLVSDLFDLWNENEVHSDLNTRIIELMGFKYKMVVAGGETTDGTAYQILKAANTCKVFQTLNIQ